MLLAKFSREINKCQKKLRLVMFVLNFFGVLNPVYTCFRFTISKIKSRKFGEVKKGRLNIKMKMYVS